MGRGEGGRDREEEGGRGREGEGKEGSVGAPPLCEILNTPLPPV